MSATLLLPTALPTLHEGFLIHEGGETHYIKVTGATRCTTNHLLDLYDEYGWMIEEGGDTQWLSNDCQRAQAAILTALIERAGLKASVDELLELSHEDLVARIREARGA